LIAVYAKAAKPKSVKGSIQIKSSHGRLQLVFSFGGKRHYLSTGWEDTVTNRAHYLPYVRFIFMTGCRPEDAIALKWKHISTDLSKIYFREALPSDTGIRGETKTGKSRVFPCNHSLQNFLRELKPEVADPEAIVFPSPSGKEIDTHNFLNRVWKPVVEALVRAGKVEQYLPQYNARHTFITLSIDHGLDAKDVACLVGNSPEIIYRNYAGSKRDLFVPEF
jgi:integrase